jgi:4-carboxymuconolactone decarboxylase
MPLDARRAALVNVSAAVASRNPENLEVALRAALGAVGDTPAATAEVDEVLLQAHLFVGFPIALEAMLLWREVCGRPPAGPLDEDPELWAERGPRVCRAVYGANYERLRANVAGIHPDLDRWMVEGGYGRVIGRPEPELALRELCIAALLVVWDAPRQLHSHLRGALNAGATAAELRAAVEVASLHATRPAADRAADLLNRITDR